MRAQVERRRRVQLDRAASARRGARSLPEAGRRVVPRQRRATAALRTRRRASGRSAATSNAMRAGRDVAAARCSMRPASAAARTAWRPAAAVAEHGERLARVVETVLRALLRAGQARVACSALPARRLPGSACRQRGAHHGGERRRPHRSAVERRGCRSGVGCGGWRGVSRSGSSDGIPVLRVLDRTG